MPFNQISCLWLDLLRQMKRSWWLSNRFLSPWIARLALMASSPYLFQPLALSVPCTLSHTNHLRRNQHFRTQQDRRSRLLGHHQMVARTQVVRIVLTRTATVMRMVVALSPRAEMAAQLNRLPELATHYPVLPTRIIPFLQRRLLLFHQVRMDPKAEANLLVVRMGLRQVKRVPRLHPQIFPLATFDQVRHKLQQSRLLGLMCLLTVEKKLAPKLLSPLTQRFPPRTLPTTPSRRRRLAMMKLQLRVAKCLPSPPPSIRALHCKLDPQKHLQLQGFRHMHLHNPVVGLQDVPMASKEIALPLLQVAYLHHCLVEMARLQPLYQACRQHQLRQLWLERPRLIPLQLFEATSSPILCRQLAPMMIALRLQQTALDRVWVIFPVPEPAEFRLCRAKMLPTSQEVDL